MLKSFDAAVCGYAQEGYCYLLDRFGLRLGDIICALILVQALAPRPLAAYAPALVCVLFGCWVSAMQREGRHQRLNWAAEQMRAVFPLRLAIIGFAVYSVAGGAALWNEGINVVLAYALTCKVRDRDLGRFNKRSAAPQFGR